MATAEEYAQWIVDNQDQQGTPEFDTVAQAYEMAKQQSQTEKTPNPVATAVQTALPLAAGNMTQATGLGELASQAAGAVSPYAKATVGPVAQLYRAHPIISGAIDAAGMATTGLPLASIGTSLSSLHDRYKGLMEGKNIAQQFLTETERIPVLNAQGQPVLDAAGNAITKPAGRDAYRALQKLNPELGAKLTEVFGKTTGGGGAGAVAEFLRSPEAAKYLETPGARQLVQEYMSQLPGVGAQAMKIAGPILRGLGRVAGPVGLGMNMYDAGQMARETQLGQRLAEGQGQRAEQAFRQHNTQYGAPISPEQAQAVLQSGSPRDIEGLGGQEFLNSVIRQQAAAQALKPVRPVRPQQLSQGQ
jgi:hypothetical protein